MCVHLLPICEKAAADPLQKNLVPGQHNNRVHRLNHERDSKFDRDQTFPRSCRLLTNHVVED